MLELRGYQKVVKEQIYNEFNSGNDNVLAVLPTGAGKTVLFGSVINDFNASSIAIAHRQELVSQIALALARYGVSHQIIAPQKTVRMCVNAQLAELGTSFYNPAAKCSVAGVDTLTRRDGDWTKRIGLVVQDEAHHLLRSNKWGKAASMFPNAKVLGVTATPMRADGKGLGSHAEGIFDSLVEGPGMRDLIAMGYLTDYRIFAPPSDIDLSNVTVGASGDYSPEKLKKAARKSHIVGDVVLHYLRLAPGKLGVTFATDVETATDIKNMYVARGVPAEVVSAKTPDKIRTEVIRRFRNREIMQLVNVDLFGEGFDLPAIEVVSMARPTQSYGLYAQQFGRALRIMDGKDVAIIIDHVGNVVRHGLPDKERVWSLDSREKTPRYKKDDDDIPLRYCTECTSPYERIFTTCPYCGTPFVPAGRGKPEYVDGDLLELDPQVLAEMRGEIRRIDEDPMVVANQLRRMGKPEAACRGAAKNHKIRQDHQAALRESIAWWAAYQREMNRGDSESYRRFYFNFGIDVLSAQALGKTEALALADKVNGYLSRIQ